MQGACVPTAEIGFHAKKKKPGKKKKTHSHQNTDTTRGGMWGVGVVGTEVTRGRDVAFKKKQEIRIQARA
jgi:hypothetical protein